MLQLNLKDLISFEDADKKHIGRIGKELNDHMLIQFQVGLWRMQRKLNFIDANTYKTIDWPDHIYDLSVFHPMLFSDPTQFLHDLLRVYWPLAYVYREVPAFEETPYELVQQMKAISMNEVTPVTIVAFVKISIAALCGLKKYVIKTYRPYKGYFRFSQYLLKYVTRDINPRVMDYVNGIENLREHNWQIRNLLQINETSLEPVAFILQAIGRIAFLRTAMPKIDKLVITCSSIKYITDKRRGLLKMFPKLRILRCDLRSYELIGPINKYLAETNKVRILSFDGKDCFDNVYRLNPSYYFPLQNYPKLIKLSFRHCRFLTDELLHVIVTRLGYVVKFGCISNPHVTPDGITFALDKLRNMRNTLYRDNNMSVVRVHTAPNMPMSVELFKMFLQYKRQYYRRHLPI